MPATTDVLLLAEPAGSILGQLAFWDGVLIVGCLVSVFLGMRVRSTFLNGLARSRWILGVWVFVFFIPLMFIDIPIGTTAEKVRFSS